MELTKEQEETIAKFYGYLGTRFTEIEAASPNAPITVCCTDEKGDKYWIRLVDNSKSTDTITNIMETGTKIENTIFYQLYALVSNDQSVFHMEMYKDGYALWFINDITPEQMKVTDEFTMIGITSALHVEDKRDAIPTKFFF
jgi:hypothetical protein